ncbi:PREDICTED: peroxidase-like [Nicrophorus vespilloides]|uniref:Peroxidase-like n=1 Tax=Nicrophorus vespilloides TaxID=110193 RepID=A0ABM1NGF2_NICVS|nr:PREDICTED: peroxidase-like [Nicrophorus vespilloides]XP_017785903.1 PREDICTED: peroxidase-like [Nicrophorus vespilloides]
MCVRILSTLVLASIVCGSATSQSKVGIKNVYFPDHINWWNETPDHDFNDVQVTQKDLNFSVEFGSGVLGRLDRLENNLAWSNIQIKQGTTAHAQLIESNPEEEALNQGKKALIAAKATIYLMNSHCYKHHLDPKNCAKHVTKYSLDETQLKSSCEKYTKKCKNDVKYRSVDGSCNRVSEPAMGETFTSYRRLLFSDYLDGVHEIRRSLFKKRPLPQPREISMKLIKQKGPEEDFTLAVMQWGMFMGHDLSHTAASKMIHSNNAIECCSVSGSKLAPRYVHPFCAPIHVPQNDNFHGIQCMTYVRSIPAMRPECTFGPMEQMNQASHFMDGSQLYGSYDAKNNMLRAFKGGLLQTTVENGKVYMPLSTDPWHHCQITVKDSTCFISGDSRANTHPQLTAMHTVWMREHNRIAKYLSKLNPDWNDEKLYQETRRIVIAQMQHITYQHWLPILLGKGNADKILSTPFNAHLDASVSNSFATGAFRMIKSMVAGNLTLYDENRKAFKWIQLSQHFNAPNVIRVPGYMDSLIRGLTVQKSKKADLDYVEDVANLMYGNGKKGFDIVSLDIQRGRDHGLPSYMAFRKLCGLSTGKTFEEFQGTIPMNIITLLSEVYKHPGDVDLIIGVLSENKMEGSTLGPTLSCILSDQFTHTRSADLYFYTNQNQPYPFTSQQLDQIKKASLARIFCDNGDDIKKMQPDVFHSIGERNSLMDCSDTKTIHKLDLNLWKTQ